MNKSTISMILAAMMATSGFAIAQTNPTAGSATTGAGGVKAGEQGGANATTKTPTTASTSGATPAIPSPGAANNSASGVKSGEQGGSATAATIAERQAKRAERKAARKAKRDARMAAGSTAGTSATPALDKAGSNDGKAKN